MGRFKVSEVFQVGKRYEIITKYKEIPVKVNMTLRWVEDEGRLLGFDWGGTPFRQVFSTIEPVYIKLLPKEYAQTYVFSNLGKELVLTVENFVDLPEFLRRSSVRVEPDEKNPVLVELRFDQREVTVEAKDISETGVGVIIHTEEQREFMEHLKGVLEHLREGLEPEFLVKIHLPGVGVAEGKGRLRNLIGLGTDVYVRLGFELNFPREGLAKVRNYIVNRQREIIRTLRLSE